jgi:hypothetical protein
MINIDSSDVRRLGLEVRRFLAKGDLLTKLGTQAKLYLEFPDVSTMRNAHASILGACQEFINTRVGTPDRYIDDHTVEIEVAGIGIVLSSRQRFLTMRGGSVGYRDLMFVEAPVAPGGTDAL